MMKAEIHSSALRRLLIIMLISIYCCSSDLSFAALPEGPAITLQTRYMELSEQLRNNQFHRELYMESAESSHDLKGEVYAVVDHPFSVVNLALNNPKHWCDVLILHLNIKYCHASGNPSATVLIVNLGRKYDQPLADTYRAEFNYHGLNTRADYFAIELNAAQGPMSTHDYRIWMEATELKDGRTFMHFTYAYGFGFSGRIAMQVYLATIGMSKTGFTVTGRRSDGKPKYIQGIRGVVERNTMRYYLAIEAYLAALNTPPQDQFEKQLQNWYDATDQYAQQLHEVERDEYLKMKRSEHQRQQSAK